jgi:hypothetical protein
MVSAAPAGFAETARFNLALIALLFRETPNDPLQTFPFFDFLSPLPINHLFLSVQVKEQSLKYKISQPYL